GVEAVLPGGVGLGTPSFGAHLIEDGTVRRVPVLRYGLEGGEAELVVETDPGTRQLALTLGTGMMFGPQPYADQPLVALSGPAGRVVVAERTAAASPEAARFRVVALSASGDSLWTRDVPYEPLPLPREEADSARASLMETLTSLA